MPTPARSRPAELSRRHLLRLGAAAAGSLALGPVLPGTEPEDAGPGDGGAGGEKPHILFLAVDDLRPQLGCYGNAHMRSPHIDRLAASGTVFERAFCQVPVCGASRASLMTGLRPTDRRFRSYKAWARKDAPDAVPLHAWLGRHGYRTVGNGKVFHHGGDHKQHWDDYFRPREFKQYQWRAERAYEGIYAGAKRGDPAWQAPDVDDDALQGGKIAAKVCRDLEAAAESGTPAFITAGLTKPHLPFIAPKRYWDLYDHDAIALAPNPFAPEDAPARALHNFGELRNMYDGMPERGPVDEAVARYLVHGYYACVSYTDAMIGRILETLEETGLRERTVVVLWGDHGWQLGEHGLWCKHCTFHTSLHAPLIVSAPGVAAGQRSRALVEFVDIYPSLCRLAGIPVPADQLEGSSFDPLLAEPDREWKQAVFARYKDGRAVKTDRWSYTEWPDGARMLYDHRTDLAENTNLSERPEHAATVARLHGLLAAGWRDALPPG